MLFRLLAPACLLLLPSTASAQEAGGAGYDWRGSYVGIFAGWAHNRTTATDISGEEYGGGSVGATMSLSDDGFIGGVLAGYNFQHGQFVFGPEFEFAGLSNDETRVINGDDGLRTIYDFYGSLAGRFGYAFDRTYVYGKGGLAFARIESAGGEYDGVGSEDSGGFGGFDGNETGTGDTTRFGWMIGFGAEHALTEEWRVKAEYSYADFGSETYDTFISGTQPFAFDDTLHTVKFGLIRRF
ncbi:outer membrane protein [Pseudohoeflea coraliihabitans]|uniref:Outer membrane beta-barrel protein n=1 Tax=Pseudohoeflea coraliihabitans TaxID=2860393 RepID=A0ABS6WJM0_9HYPH|nr:outer membrane beta-barrel protein [Pseudohoeflea sp. DP4N28-3]MBW3095960.1 outer membrane beta-barrel protein [Pseudohoeflea sp. DP4N28-3]